MSVTGTAAADSGVAGGGGGGGFSAEVRALYSMTVVK